MMELDFGCPFCGQKKVVCDDCVDTYTGGDNYLINFCVGHCTNCGNNVQYEEVYTFIKYQNIELG
jgi:transcription elongation factor Elf1